MTGALVGIFALYKLTLAPVSGDATVFETVYANCIVSLVTLVYYCMGKFLYSACFPASARARRRGCKVMLVPRAPDGSYSDMQQTPTEVVWGVPRLTLQNVWILVYGVGFILFVSGYCILGLNPLCLACFGLAVSVLCVDELVCPPTTQSKLYTSARCAALIAAVVSLVLVTTDLFSDMFGTFVQTIDLYALTFGLCLPFIVQFLMVTVRESRHYSLGSVFEVCEFGLPFTVFLSVFHLSVAYGQQFQLDQKGTNSSATSATVERVFRTDAPFVVFHCLAPLLVAPTLVAYVTCVLEGAAIDPLVSISLALSVHYLVAGRISTLGIYGTVCGGLAFANRVVAEYHPPAPGPRCFDTQLPPDVWRQRERDAQELTSVLGDDTEVAWQRKPDGPDIATV